MQIVGIGHFVVHDSSVGIVSDEGITFALSEERLTRKKHDGSFPRQAMRLASNRTCDVAAAPYLDSIQCEREHREASDLKRYDRVQRMQQRNEYVLRAAGVSHFMGHHFSHAAGAYYTSGFSNAIVITYDGGINCEPWLATIWRASPQGLTPISKLTQQDGATAAIRYSAVTSLLGFRPIHDEGKVTGLAACGQPSDEITDRLVQAFRMMPELVSYYNGCFADRFSGLRKFYSDRDIAASIQRMTEAAIIDLIRASGLLPTEHDCILSGGLFANVTLNLAVKRMGFKRLYVYPAMGDEGLAIGCAAATAMTFDKHHHAIEHVFFGPAWTSDDISGCLAATGLPFRRIADIDLAVAELLAAGKVVCRYIGKSEFGPRALGNRSILCRAAECADSERLNKYLLRNEIMPFAPVTTEELAASLFDELPGMERCTAFMTTVVPCTDLMKRLAPAAVHIDGTARPQIVAASTNPGLHRIVTHYYKLTGAPALINTSFNMHGEPIVCSPSDAIRTFVKSQLDYLAIGDYLVGLPQ